jgi:hypothetical protein
LGEEVMGKPYNYITRRRGLDMDKVRKYQREWRKKKYRNDEKYREKVKRRQALIYLFNPVVHRVVLKRANQRYADFKFLKGMAPKRRAIDLVRR